MNFTRGNDMHSHDRTMLQRMGFTDPDKKDRRHDWACQYLAQKEIGERLIRSIWDCDVKTVKDWKWWSKLEGEVFKGEDKYRTSIGWIDLALAFQLQREWMKRITNDPRWVNVDSSSLTEAGWTPTRFYRREVSEPGWDHQGWNFTDRSLDRRVHVECPINPPWSEDRLRFSTSAGCWQLYQRERTEKREETEAYGVIVEVKIAPVALGDVMRQIALYRQYSINFRPTHAINWKYAVLATTYELDACDFATLLKQNIHHIYLGRKFEEYCEQRQASGQKAISLEF
jgi:hypothetical protein